MATSNEAFQNDVTDKLPPWKDLNEENIDQKNETENLKEKVTYDELMTKIGEFGPRQFSIFLAYSMGLFVEVLIVMSFVFVAGTHTSHNCKEIGLAHLNLSSELIRNISVGGLDECHMYHRDYSNWTMQTVQDWIKNPFDNHTEVVECMYGYEYDPYPYKDTIVTEWDLVCNDNWKAYLPYSIVGVGEAVGALFWGYVIDRFGRMYPFMYSMLALSLFSLGSAFSPYYYSFCILQFFIGIHAVSAYTIGPTAIVEISGVKYRGHLLTAYNYFWTLGNLVVPLVAFFVRRWSTLQMSISIISLISLLLLIFIKESPRWLYSKGKNQKAFSIIKSIARSNKRSLSKDIIVDIGGSQDENVSIFNLLASKTLIIITLILCLAWFTNSLLYFGLALYVPTMSQNPHLNFFISGVVEIPGYVIAQLCLAYIPRKTAVSSLFILAAICLFTLFPISKTELLVLEIGMAMVGKMLATTLMSVLTCFSSEMFPTVARGSGFFFCILFNNIANILAPQFNLLPKFVPPIVFAATSLVTGILCVFLPETKDRPLCDTVEEMKEHRKLGAFSYRGTCFKKQQKVTTF